LYERDIGRRSILGGGEISGIIFMRIGVIGTINRDTVRLADGTIKKGWGGILYNLVTLSNLIGKNSEIIPVCNIGHDSYKDIVSILKRLPGVNIDYIRKVPQKNNHCHLTYCADGEKSEILKGGVPSLRYSDLTPLLNCDMVLVNYISGRDIGTRSLQKFGNHFQGIIYIDIHSSTLGKRKDGSRFLRAPRGWEKIVAAADFIQMNRTELTILTGEYRPGKSYQNSPVSSLKKLFDFMQKSGAKSKSVYLITDGSNGCYLFSPSQRNGGLNHILPERIFRTGDATGCGDCYAAGFIAAWGLGKSPIESAYHANIAAGKRIAGHKIYDILSVSSIPAV
jgi:sugar/nucleoside kinase (ribokinase family)